MTEEQLREASEAWNSHDAERVLSFMTDDCVYYASFGADLMGKRFVGRDAVREGVAAFFERYPDCVFADGEVFVAGDRGASEWTFRATEKDGTPVEVRGCDLFEFAGDRIRVKNAFRKLREAPSDGN